MATLSRTYAKEHELVKDICAVLISRSSPWGTVRLAEEFFYQRGRTDIIAVEPTSQIIAFEVKLHKWRDGIRQAYRNTCFAHFSYLVLPEEAARIAASAIGEFTRHSTLLVPGPDIEPMRTPAPETGTASCGVSFGSAPITACCDQAGEEISSERQRNLPARSNVLGARLRSGRIQGT